MKQTCKRLIAILLLLSLLCSMLPAVYAADETATLVTDAATLKAGDQILIVANGYDCAISTTQNTSNRGQATVTKSGSTLTYGTDAQIITLETGSVSGTFAFNVGSGYLYAASSSANNLKTTATLSANASWRISIDSTGVASIVASGSYTRNVLRYNATSKLFSCYAASNSQKDLSIYKLGSGSAGSDDAVLDESCNHDWRNGYCTRCGGAYVEIITDPTGYTTASDVVYKTVNGYIANWGARGEICNFLSTYAQDFYKNGYTYSELSNLKGGSGANDAHNSPLYTSLQNLMVNNHTTFTKYGGSTSKDCKNFYQYTDCLKGNTAYVSTIYRGLYVAGAWDGGTTYNQEHIWPHSKCIGTNSTDVGDIMHLRAANPSENSSRNNTAYGESDGYYDPGLSVRGDCARTLLYLYTRWGNTEYLWGADGVIENLDILLKWIAEDPVDTWEMGHNDAVQSITGTRNVFVDYPELAYQLFGEAVPATLASPSATKTNYYLFGWINGANYACEEDYTNMGEYKFVNGKLTTTFASDSYVAVKTEGNGAWYMAKSYAAQPPATLVVGGNEKLFVPGGVEVTFTLTENADGSLTLSYAEAEPVVDYYLIGYINGANYGCEEDAANLGKYKFVDGKLTATFASDSYVFVKTGDNAKWYLTSAYAAEPPATLVIGGSEKLFVPGGAEIAFTLTENSNGSLTLSYVIGNCPHNWGDGVVTKDATCTANGVKTYTCSICGETKTETIKANGHNYVYGTCTVCGGKDASYVPAYYLVGFINGANHGCEEDAANMGNYKFVDGKLTVTFHSDSYVFVKTEGNTTWYLAESYVSTPPATLIIGGTEKLFVPGGTEIIFTLTVNSDSVTLNYVISSCSHNWDDGVVTKDATCTKSGVKTYTCSICSETKTETISATGHNYKATVTAPTCTEGGYTTYTCANCSDSYTGNTTSATGHKWNSGVVTKAATCTESGVKTYTCTTCKTKKTESIAAIGHNYKAVVTAPTCTEGGYTTYTCANCSDSYTGNATAATGHKWNNGVVTKAATCTVDGVKTYTCTTCKTKKTESIAAIGHNYKAVVTAPTCTEGGYTTYTCANCSDSYTGNTVPANGHDYVYGTCSVCGGKDTDYVPVYYLVGFINGTNYGCEEDAANMGKYQFANGKLTATFDVDSYVFVKTEGNTAWYLAESYTAAPPATLVIGGSEKLFVPGGAEITFTLKVDSNDSLTLSYVITNCPHNWGEGVVTKDATCTTNGVKTYTCSICGETKTERIAAYGHNYKGTVTAPTCTEKGYTTYTCSNCSHSYIDDIVAANGHNYVYGTCSVCGAKDADYVPVYYLVGFINGANYGCEEDAANMGQYKFVGSKLTATFDTDSYVFVKTEGNTAWYMAESYVSAPPATLVIGGSEKLFVPGGAEITFTLKVNSNNSLTLSYVITNCPHNWVEGETKDATCTENGETAYTCSICKETKTETIKASGHDYVYGTCTVCGDKDASYVPTYYLVGFINGANHGCEEDAANMGEYKFVNGKLTVLFNSDSYVFVKTEGNTAWYLAESYVSTPPATLVIGGTEKLFVPGGTEIIFTLTAKGDSVTLDYVISSCDHSYDDGVVTVKPSCETEGVTVYTCTKCGDQFSITSAATGHNYKGSVTTAATCTKDGVKTYTCSNCGDSYTEVIPANGHNYVNSICSVCGAIDPNCDHTYTSKVTVAPTCTESGVKTYTCSKCGDVYTETIAANGHSYVDIVVPPTCENNGYTRHQCKICGEYGANTDPVNPIGHKYSAVVTPPTCTEDGYTTYTCANCGNTYIWDETPATGHNYVAGTCTGCGDVDENYVLEYYLVGYINGANYGCEEDAANMGQYQFANGKLTATFDVDSYVFIKTTDNGAWYLAESYVSAPPATLVIGGSEKLFVPGGAEITFTLTENADGSLTLSYVISNCPHNWVEGETKDATCTEDGVISYTCSICGETKTETIKANGHDYVYGTCTVCGGKDATYVPVYYLVGYINGANYGCEEDYENMGQYKFVGGKLTAAFDTDSYVFVKTEGNTAWYMAESYVAVPPATLVTGGSEKLFVPGGAEITFTLTVNGDTLTLSYVISDCSHNWDDGVVTKDATCTEDGVKTYTCSICSETKTESITAYGHNYKAVVTAPSCTEGGYTTYTCANCSHSYTGDAVAAIGHKWNNGVVTKAATCTESGVKTYTCSTCKTTKTETISAIGHSYEGVVTAPTCTEGGYTTYTCANCSDSYTGNATAATGHKWNNGVVTKAATCTESGVKTYTCRTCKTTKTETISATGHKYVNGTCSYCGIADPNCSHSYTSSITVRPTCTESGIKTYTCSMCGDVYTETMAATGHSYKEVVTAPTCTEGGYTTYTCANCFHSYTGNATAATGHTYVNGTCSSCGAADPNAAATKYYLVGYINGADYGCQEDYQNMGEYLFVNGKLTATFDIDSYVFVKTEGNTAWYMTTSYVATPPATLVSTGGSEKLFVPGGVEVTFTLTENADGTLTLSYTTSGSVTPDPEPETNYYLVGFINGADYGCEGDHANMGEYKFVDSKLTATFAIDSYVFVKTEGNGAWYMTDSYVATPPATLKVGGNEKLFVPGGAEVTFTLTENTNGTLTLSYTTAAVSVVQPTITPKYPSLSFEGEVYYNVAFAATDVESVVEWGLITFESNVTNGTINNADYIIPGSIYDPLSDYYKVRSNGIPAKKLGDTLYFRVYAKLTDGSYAYSGTYNYSAVDYAKDRFINSSNANLKSLCVAMLNYGAAAQTHFGYNTGSLMNANLTAEQKAMVRAYDSSMVKSLGSVTATKAGAFTYTSGAFKSRYPSVSFEGAFAISYYFETAYAPDNGVTLYYWDEATFNSVSTLTVSNATGTLAMDLNNATLYKGTIEDIAAKEIDSPIYVAGVYTSGGTTYCTGVLPYSLGAYCVDRAANGSATMQAFAAATAVYGYYAKVYFGVA